MVPSPDPIQLDPAAVLTAYRARTRQQMAAASQREADLLEEIAQLEAYIAYLRAPQTVHDPDPTPDAWGTTDPTPGRNA